MFYDKVLSEGKLFRSDLCLVSLVMLVWVVKMRPVAETHNKEMISNAWLAPTFKIRDAIKKNMKFKTSAERGEGICGKIKLFIKAEF